MNRLAKALLVAGIGASAAITMSASAQAATCVGVSFGASFAGSYSCNSLGTPTGVTGSLGGITFLDNDTLLIGGNANASSGYIAQIDVVRDSGNHIVGFGSPSSLFSTAPNIDGGLSFGPDGVLFATGYSNNTLLQIKPGSTTPDKITTLPGSLSSVGALAFVPAGFAGAGTMKLLSYSNGNWATGTLTPDGSGTFNISVGPVVTTLTGGPEGIVYVDESNAGFGGVDNVLISEYGAGRVGAYQIDANGDPISGTRQDFITGLSGAEGAVIDPLTGDFLFSTFGGGNQVMVISGFTAPPPPAVPEPASWAMMILGFGAAGTFMRRSKARVALRFA